MKGDICEIRIYDRDFNWLGVTQLAESVQFTRNLYGAGVVEIHIDIEKAGAMELAGRNNIIMINGDTHKTAIIRDFYVEEKKDSRQLVVYAETGNGLCRQRRTIPPTQAQDPNALGWDKINSNAETILKHFIDKNIVNPYDTQRRIDNVVIAENMHRGISFPWKSRYQPLDEEMTNIATYAEMGYAFYGNVSDKKWIFDVIEGTNRTVNQDIVSPITFRMEYQNVEGYKYIEDYQNYKNTGYAGGAGEDEKRLVYIIGADNTGLDRWETFLDCGNAANISELIYYGGQKLNEYKPAKTIEAQTLPRVFLFDKDYFLGDIVTVIISRLGLSIDMRITNVKEVWERKSGHRIELSFGEKVPNVFTLLKKSEEVK